MVKKIFIIMLSIILIITGILIFSEDNVTYAVGTTLSDIVISQSKGTTWESGASGVYNTIYTKENGTTIGSDYRYIGVGINNYVSFNNDLYQIIGVFDENTHGKTGQKLVKLIRAKMISANSFGVYNTTKKNGSYSAYGNDWTGKQYTTPANLNILLNEYFYNKTNTSDTYGDCIDWTYFNNSNDYKISNCSTIVGYGIKQELRNYIELAKWHLYGIYSTDMVSNDIYLCERGMYTGCVSANNGAGDIFTNTKIGLMYLSDYMYASGYKATDSDITGSSAYNGNENWLLQGSEWVITPRYKNGTTMYFASSGGSIGAAVPYIANAFRPTFYLKSDVYVTGGNGSFDNPYTIACDTCG